MTESDIEVPEAHSGLSSYPCHASDHPVGIVAGKRLLVDMDRWCGLGFEADPDELLHETCRSLRLRASVLPGGRAERSTVRWAIARQLLEEQAFALRQRFGIREIIDAGLVGALDHLAASRDASGEPSIIMTNPARLLRRRPGQWHRLASRLSSGRPWPSEAAGVVDHTLSADSRRREILDIGDGWVESTSGRRRQRDDLVTLVCREPGGTGRVDVRLVGVERIMSLRFRGLDDEAFETFWARWTDSPDAGAVSPATL